MEASTSRSRSLSPLTGALFVVLVLVAFIAIGGETPDGDASVAKVVKFYDDNSGKEIAAAIVLALSTVPLLYFAGLLRERMSEALPGRSALPNWAFGGGIVCAGGFLLAAGIHFTLADYADNIRPVALQAINALDGNVFLPFSTGLAVLLVAASAASVRTGYPAPKWMGWVGIVLFVVFFTPAGFVAFGLTGLWVIVVSVMMYLRGDAVPATT